MTVIVSLVLLGALVCAATAGAQGSGPPVNTEAPTIGGVLKEGKTLNAKVGTWTGATPITYGYRWERCAGSQCTPIEGATGSSYVLQTVDIGATIRVVVFAKNSAGEAEAESAPTSEVSGIVPRNTVPPAIEQSEPEEGELLTANAGTWSGSPVQKYIYVWEAKCPRKTCSFIREEETLAEHSSFRVPSEVVAANGATVTVQVTDVNAAGSKSAISEPTQAVKPGPPVNVAPPTISGEAREGSQLSASPGTWAGTRPLSAFEYQWLACNTMTGCAAIPGATGPTYKPTGVEAIGHDTIEVTVATKNSVGSASATSNPTSEVKGNPPVNVLAPAITGQAKEGEPLEPSQTLTVSNGTWAGTEPFSYEYQWLLCRGGECTPVVGATASSYTLVAEDVGATIEATVTAKGAVEPPGKATSAQTAAVVGAYYAVSWGENARGDLGAIYTNGAEPSPISVETPKLVQIEHGIGLTSEGTVVTWGMNHSGQLGDGDPSYASSWERPGGYAEVIELSNVKRVAAAGTHRMALLDNGEVRTWGGDQYGEFGISAEKCPPFNGDKALEKELCPPNRPEKAELPLPATAITAGGGTDFALLEDGEVYAWGEDINGQAGVGTELEIERCDHTEFQKKEIRCIIKPRPVLGANGKPIGRNAGEHVVEITAGYESGYALLENGRVLAWGDNSKGQLGDGQETGHSKFTLATEVVTEGIGHPALTGVSEVAAGEKFALARVGGEVVGWGSTATGQLGEVTKEQEQECGGSTCVTGAVPVPGVEHGVEQIAAGDATGYALEGGEVYSWGGNHEDQLGDGEPIKEESEVGGGEGEEGACVTAGKECRLRPEPVLERSGSIGHPGEPLRNVHSVYSNGQSAYALVTGTRPNPLVSWTGKEANGTLSFTVSWRAKEIGEGEKLNFTPLEPSLAIAVTGDTKKGSYTITEAEAEGGQEELEELKVGMSTAKKGAFDDRAKIVSINPGTHEITLNKEAIKTEPAETGGEPANFVFETVEGENEQLRIPAMAESMEVKEYKSNKGDSLEARPYLAHLHTQGQGAGAEERTFTVMP